MKNIIRKITAILLSFLLLPFFFTKVSATDRESSAEQNEQAAIERMREGLEGFYERIDLSDLNIDAVALTSIFAAATKNTPYLFYVDKKLTYTYRTGGKVIAVMPKYILTEREAEEALRFCREEVGKMAELAMRGENELERLVLIHDLLCSRFSYDLSLESNNIYTFLKEGKGTCQGYTWIYMAVLREMGIECEYVASDSIAHIWLRVKIDGEWYNSDVTWDDPVGSEEEQSPISRRHILFSDVKADRDGYKDRYSASQNKCTGEKYDESDLADVLSPSHACGDVNHDGGTDLFDLMMILKDIAPCPICADIDGDFFLTATEEDMLREYLLTNGCE